MARGVPGHGLSSWIGILSRARRCAAKRRCRRPAPDARPRSRLTDVRVDFMRSAHNGSASGHVLTLRVAERIRRLAAAVSR